VRQARAAAPTTVCRDPQTRQRASRCGGWKEVTVQRDCYVVFDGSFYSAPFRAIGQRVRVRGGNGEVKVYDPNYVLGVFAYPVLGKRLLHTGDAASTLGCDR